MKNINVLVYNSNVLVYNKNKKLNFNVEGIYEFMGKCEEMIELLGEGVEINWSNVKEYKSRFNEVYCIKFEDEDSDVMLRFIDKSKKV